MAQSSGRPQEALGISGGTVPDCKLHPIRHTDNLAWPGTQTKKKKKKKKKEEEEEEKEEGEEEEEEEEEEESNPLKNGIRTVPPQKTNISTLCDVITPLCEDLLKVLCVMESKKILPKRYTVLSPS